MGSEMDTHKVQKHCGHISLLKQQPPIMQTIVTLMILGVYVKFSIQLGTFLDSFCTNTRTKKIARQKPKIKQHVGRITAQQPSIKIHFQVSEIYVWKFHLLCQALLQMIVSLKRASNLVTSSCLMCTNSFAVCTQATAMFRRCGLNLISTKTFNLKFIIFIEKWKYGKVFVVKLFIQMKTQPA